jgi:hypothetical protein
MIIHSFIFNDYEDNEFPLVSAEQSENNWTVH